MNYHGGGVHNYNRRIIDFSSNINPFGVPASFKIALLSNLDEFTKYPDMSYIELRRAIANYVDIQDIEAIAVGNGAIELIYRAIRQSGKKKLICLKPTFSEYSRAALLGGMQYASVAAFDSDFLEIDVEFLLKEADDDSVLVLCNPNNPTGSLVKKQQLLWLASELKSKGALMIIDEAFMEFTDTYPEGSMVSELDSFENLIVVKAATKFFGMPGIRLGYAMSSNIEMIKAIKNGMEPWNVNTAAVIAGFTVLKDCDYINSSREWIKTERPEMYKGLRSIEGLKVFQTVANFHLVRLLNEDIDAWQLKERLLKFDILIRTPEGFESLNGKFARIAVKSPEDNRLLIKCLKGILSY